MNSNTNQEFIKEVILKIKSFGKEKFVSVRKIGISAEGRVVYSLKFGRGRKRVLAWTQMHGDEPISTLAALDFLSRLFQRDNAEEKEEMLSKLTFELIPLLNPDGAVKNIRYNSFGIDINRDALTLISPEAKILQNEFQKFKPHFALNLHDQDCYHTAGNSQEPVWLSFLATVGSEKKKETAPRRKSMNVIGKTVSELKKLGIKNIARYDDEFEPRAFGDNFVKAGTAVILIEAGCAEKKTRGEFERKLFSTALYSVLKNIANYRSDLKFVEQYKKLPENGERMLDLIFENVAIKRGTKISLGVKEGKIEAAGDLSVYGAFEKIDANGLFLIGEKMPGENANFSLTTKSGKKVLTCKKGKITWAK